ncbi:MAG TPA: hypothetical protein VK742_19665 [Candidatus Sulfotelmatobacter sp.]|jgi:hypothetical protein|nr:hypothetical protein [Candidatus Sulfotelmatobacter sp.]
MTDDSKSDGRHHLFPWTVTLLIVIPIIYLLSVGPALWLRDKTGIGHSPWVSSLSVIYQPFKWMYLHSAGFKNFMDAYLKLFGVR